MLILYTDANSYVIRILYHPYVIFIHNLNFFIMINTSDMGREINFKSII